MTKPPSMPLKDALELWAETYADPTPLKTICPKYHFRLGQDQYRCAHCGMVWDIDEPRPPCLSTSATTGENK